VTLSPGGVLALALKPSDDGKGLILRLFGASGRDEQVTLTWAAPQPRSVWLSDALEQPLSPVTGAISVPAWGLVTVRAE
jgi:alpha-mannosidase